MCFLLVRGTTFQLRHAVFGIARFGGIPCGKLHDDYRGFSSPILFEVVAHSIPHESLESCVGISNKNVPRNIV